MNGYYLRPVGGCPPPWREVERVAASAAGSHAPELLAALRAERARKAQPGLPLAEREEWGLTAAAGGEGGA